MLTSDAMRKIIVVFLIICIQNGKYEIFQLKARGRRLQTAELHSFQRKRYFRCVVFFFVNKKS